MNTNKKFNFIFNTENPLLRKNNSVITLGPVLLFLLAIFAYPVIRLLVVSFLENGLLTFEHYERVFSILYLKVFWKTLLMAFSVTIFSTLLGYPVAYFLANTPKKVSQICIIFVLIPFWTSLLVRTYAWMVLLGRDGIINNWLLSFGITNEPVQLMYNWFGVNIGMVHVLMPFLIFPMYSVMTRIDMNLIHAAEGLGANKLQTFIKVYFPLSLPGVQTGSIMVFVLSLGFYITPALLGGGKVIMISNLIEEQVSQFLNWGFASALAVILLIVTIILFSIYNRILGWDKTWT